MPDVRARVESAWTALLDALRRAGYAVDELVRPGATAGALAAAESAIGRRLPEELRALYEISDGQVEWNDLVHGPDGTTDRGEGRWVGSIFGAGWTFAPLTELVRDWAGWNEVRAGYSPEELAAGFDDVIDVRGDDPVRGVYTHPDWVGFAIDGGGNALAVDLAPAADGRAGQVIVIGPDEDLRRVVAQGVVALMEVCRERLVAEPPVADEPKNGVRLYNLE